MTRSAAASILLAAVVALSSTSVACSGEQATAAAPKTPDAGGPDSAVSPAPEDPSGAASAGDRVTGTVMETMDAGSYTYVRVKTSTGEIWAAANRFATAVGQRVTVPLEMPMTNFHSDSLNRDFPLVYFASAITPEGQPPAGRRPEGALAPAVSHGQMAPGSHPAGREVTAVTEVIAQPPGGTTVADLWANRKALQGRTVTVRGKVVKFNGGILDRNWIHLQDGTGNAGERTNDVTVTTTGSAKVGDVITVSGAVAVDKDFGAGYAYPVIIENATVAVK